MMNDVLRLINDRGTAADRLKLSPDRLAEILRLVDAGTINTSTGKSLLVKVEDSGRSPAEIVQAEGLAKVSDDTAIRTVAAEVVAENPKEVESYRSGKVTLIGWFVGQVMKKMRGKADPTLVRTILEEMLKS
jgi:aspartyl-tRNA(Asn)/glutamyl-tRNA(Gln) amidotransferase subunit B